MDRILFTGLDRIGELVIYSITKYFQSFFSHIHSMDAFLANFSENKISPEKLIVIKIIAFLQRQEDSTQENIYQIIAGDQNYRKSVDNQ